MLPDIKGYKNARLAYKTAEKIRKMARQGWEIGQEIKGLEIRVVTRLWSDNRVIVVCLCESHEAMQFGISLCHMGINCYVTNAEWWAKETAQITMSPIVAGIFRKENEQKF